MSIGNPQEAFSIFGRNVPRYMVGYYCLGIYIGLYALSKVRRSAPPPITMDPQEAQFVKDYIKHHEEESHTPLYVKGIFKKQGGGH
ncbi:hypothetical protein SeMB42_g07569 [Synchytrium endobioticum]|uniref:Uncharacterized protein n=1 Tax=Synchytrium endobioticum TaxID=286115 RepID=A0A507C1C4_9FUNG|nr:hypothetical protein SeMB42_g07569 [Synchytrium endobioticum]TPX38832.1 hypothetical protein SeLEV6574_g07590 [Synchytrium endobioticum]